MDNDTLTTEAPERDLDPATTAPHEQECLPCYLNRMLATHSCDNHLRWAERWRQRHKTPALFQWLRSNGGYCDCEVLFNVYRNVLPDEDEPLKECAGIRRPGSTQACGAYDRMR